MIRREKIGESGGTARSEKDLLSRARSASWVGIVPVNMLCCNSKVPVRNQKQKRRVDVRRTTVYVAISSRTS